ncbi:MAG: S-layer homology domain-containing protein [Aulosira sp. DedQUE10]|nr:S-layer homology domain-containing protein [Aulosira sp. DedQUE10]
MLEEKILSILLLKKIPCIFLGIGRILVTGLLLTTAMSTHSAAAEDGLVADNPSSKLSSAKTSPADSASVEISIEQDINWGQVALEDSNPTVEFSSSQKPQASSTGSDIIAKRNADLRAKDVLSQKTETALNQNQPRRIAQTDSSSVVGDTFVKQTTESVARQVNLRKKFPALRNITAQQTLKIPQKVPQLAQQTTLSDIQGNWAQSFIELLNQRGIIQGFPDGTFRPDEPVTRAQFAAMIQKAFQKAPVRNAVQFVDLPANYWGKDAIETAYKIGFLQGYPGNVFQPDQNIPRVQALVSLATGLNLSANTPTSTVLNTYFQDAAQIPDYALKQVSAAAESNLVVNYPNVQILNPNQVATRAEVAAFIYQAMVKDGTAPELTASETATQYIVGYKPSPDTAQTTPDIEELRQSYRLPSLPSEQLRVITTGIVSIPGSSVTSPTAFGAAFGDVFAGASYQSSTRLSSNDDGGLVFGFGLGKRETVGLEVAVSSFSTFRQGFFDNGGVSFKLHHLFPNNMAIAFGIENAVTFGSPDGGSSVYGVVSKVFQLQNDSTKPFSALTVSVGLGGGRFRSEQDVIKGEDSVNVFGSVGLRVIEPISLIADWTGQDLTIGTSIAPFRNFPLVITPAVADITGNAGNGARFVLGVGFGYSF